MNMWKSFLCGLGMGVMLNLSALAVDLVGSASVNVTSDTAATAKDMAFDEARRQIIVDVMRQYVDVDALGNAVKNAKRSELTKLISASSIGGEQVSDTTYSAQIAMTIDADAMRGWLAEKNIQHWIPDGTNTDVFVVDVKMSDGLKNWGQLIQIAQNEKIDLGTKFLTRDSATLELPRSVRGRFTIALREAGWHYANQDGNLKIWK